MRGKKQGIHILLLVFSLVLISACSNQSEERSSDALTNEESKETTVNSSEEEAEDEDNTIEEGENSETREEAGTTEDVAETSMQTDQNANAAEDNSDSGEFDIAAYVKTNYAMENMHYEMVNLGRIEGTEITDYTVNILPDNEEFSAEINAIFTDGILYEDERTAAMMNHAERIIDLPLTHNNLHIDSVNWVSYDGDFQVMLIQDYEQSTISR